MSQNIAFQNLCGLNKIKNELAADNTSSDESE